MLFFKKNRMFLLKKSAWIKSNTNKCHHTKILIVRPTKQIGKSQSNVLKRKIAILIMIGRFV